MQIFDAIAPGPSTKDKREQKKINIKRKNK